MMTHSTSGRRRQQGLSLVEIMVALFIGLFLTAGILQIFAGTRQTYRFEEALSRIQENGRFALETIARDARMAGFAGCTRVGNLPTPVIHANDVEFTNAVIIRDQPPASITVASDTDLIRIRALGGTGARVENTNPPDENESVSTVSIESNPDQFVKDDVVAIADCNAMDIFRVDSISGSGPMTITPNAALSKTYLEGSQVFRLRDVTYYVDTGTGGELALRRAGAQSGDLVEGVEDMWIVFGEDTTGNGVPNLYRSANDVANWERVFGLRVSLLLVSNDDNLTGGPQSVEWRNATLTPTDSRLRQVFTTTIALRNRLP